MFFGFPPHSYLMGGFLPMRRKWNQFTNRVNIIIPGVSCEIILKQSIFFRITQDFTNCSSDQRLVSVKQFDFLNKGRGSASSCKDEDRMQDDHDQRGLQEDLILYIYISV